MFTWVPVGISVCVVNGRVVFVSISVDIRLRSFRSLGLYPVLLVSVSTREQVRLVNVKAERPNYPSRCHQAGGCQPCGEGSAMGVGGGGPPRRHVHDFMRPIRLTVALGLKIKTRALFSNVCVCKSKRTRWLHFIHSRPFLCSRTFQSFSRAFCVASVLFSMFDVEEQVRFVSVKAQHPDHSSHDHVIVMPGRGRGVVVVGGAASGEGGGGWGVVVGGG